MWFYSLLILITCTEIQHKAYHSRSKIRHLKLAFIGSEQYVALNLPQQNSYTLLSSAVNLLSVKNSYSKQDLKTSFLWLEIKPQDTCLCFIFPLCFHSPETTSQDSVEAGQVQQFLWIWQLHLTKKRIFFVAELLALLGVQRTVCHLKNWWQTRVLPLDWLRNQEKIPPWGLGGCGSCNKCLSATTHCLLYSAAPFTHPKSSPRTCCLTFHSSPDKPLKGREIKYKLLW